MVMWLSCAVFDSADEVAQLLHTQCKQYWFEKLATSILLHTRTTHLLLLLLLWGRDQKPGGSRTTSTCKGRWAGQGEGRLTSALTLASWQYCVHCDTVCARAMIFLSAVDEHSCQCESTRRNTSNAVVLQPEYAELQAKTTHNSPPVVSSISPARNRQWMEPRHAWC
jgi:hypothetical protein